MASDGNPDRVAPAEANNTDSAEERLAARVTQAVLASLRTGGAQPSEPATYTGEWNGMHGTWLQGLDGNWTL